MAPRVAAVAKRILATKTDHLPVPLTAAELAKVAEEMGRVEGDLREFYNKKKEITSDLKQKEDRLDSEMGRLGRLQRDKKEYRPVAVRVEADYRVGKVYEIREDTGEVVAERPVTEHDKQTTLFEGAPRATPEELGAEACLDCGIPANQPSTGCDSCDHGRTPTAEQRKAAERAKVERQADELLKNAGAGELTKKELKGDAVARRKGGRRG